MTWTITGQNKTLVIWEKATCQSANRIYILAEPFLLYTCCAWPCQDLPVVNSSYNACNTEPNTVWNSVRSEYRQRPSRVLPECEQLSVVISCSILEALYWCYLTSHFLSPLLFSPSWLSALLWLLSPVPLCIKARMFLYYFLVCCVPRQLSVLWSVFKFVWTSGFALAFFLWNLDLVFALWTDYLSLTCEFAN